MSTENQPTKSEETRCTCGSCIDGWLSPRMRERLEDEAELLHLASSSLLDDVAPSAELIPEWCIAADLSLQYIPTDLRDKMTPLFWRGHMLVMESIMQLFFAETPSPLADADADADADAPAPTLAALAEYLEEKQAKGEALDASLDAASKPAAFCSDAAAIRHYLSSGGRPAFALEALLDRAETKSSRGAEYRRKAAVREEEDEFMREVDALSKCAHDLDFDLVRRKMGLPAECAGPYWIFLSDSEGEDDDDEGGEEVIYEGTKFESATTGGSS